jgi:hypothetical protein
LKKVNRLKELENVSFDELILKKWDAQIPESSRLEHFRSLLMRFSKFFKKIESYVNVFGAKNVLVIHNDDMRSNGVSVVNQVFEFLDLAPFCGADFTEKRYMHGSEHVNISKSVFFYLAEEFGDDYYKSCRDVRFLRPKAPAPTYAFNQPVGALVNSIGVGEDGWLFLAGGSNDVLEMYIEEDDAQKVISHLWYEVVERRKENFEKIGAVYRHIMLPEKISVLGEKLRWPIDFKRSRGKNFNANTPQNLRNSIIDLISYMQKIENKEMYFFKTDSHWNHLGAFLAYQMICANLGVEARADLLARSKSRSRMILDLGSKLPDRPDEEAVFAHYRVDSHSVSDDGLVRYKREHKLEKNGDLHVGSFVSFRYNNAPHKMRICIFGDSFSEYRDHLLTGLMADTFSEVTFIWSTSVDYGYCEAYKPDFVFCIMTERFMSRVPDDTFDFQKFARMRISSFSASSLSSYSSPSNSVTHP